LPRLPRLCPPGYPVHVIQRGNNRQVVFTSERDIVAYAHWLDESAANCEVSVHGWVFMTNHVHLLLTPRREDGISKLLQFLGRRYVRYFNFAYARSGTLFDGRFKSSLVQDDQYFLSCLRYIELNPVRAGMVTDPEDYRWSSYGVHAHGRKASMWTAHPTYLGLGKTDASRQYCYRELVSDALDQEVISKIRHCANSGLVLGTEQFRKQFVGMPE